jgi:hypothetical protein
MVQGTFLLCFQNNGLGGCRSALLMRNAFVSRLRVGQKKGMIGPEFPALKSLLGETGTRLKMFEQISRIAMMRDQNYEPIFEEAFRARLPRTGCAPT